MSRRQNGTNRAGAAICVNCYTGKLMPRKKKAAPSGKGNGALKITYTGNYSRN